MEAATRAALIASIEKWDANAEAEYPSDAHVYAESCPLCAIFDADDDMARPSERRCVGCPVKESWVGPGRVGCKNTPWVRACHAYAHWREGVADRQVFRDAARAEADFLRGLLPEATS